MVARFPVALEVPPEGSPRIPECAGYAVGIVALYPTRPRATIE
jgi:hypothetical protein